MQSTPRERLLQFAQVLQAHLFERIGVEVGPLSEKARRLVAVLSSVPLSRYLTGTRVWR